MLSAEHVALDLRKERLVGVVAFNNTRISSFALLSVMSLLLVSDSDSFIIRIHFSVFSFSFLKGLET